MAHLLERQKYLQPDLQHGDVVHWLPDRRFNYKITKQGDLEKHEIIHIESKEVVISFVLDARHPRHEQITAYAFELALKKGRQTQDIVCSGAQIKAIWRQDSTLQIDRRTRSCRG